MYNTHKNVFGIGVIFTETLQKLMRRIQNQRQDWRDKSVQDLSSGPLGVSSARQHPRGTEQTVDAGKINQITMKLQREACFML